MFLSASIALLVTIVGSVNANDCPKVTTVPDLNITEYTRASWYVQKQQLTGYQKMEDLFCVTATYKDEGKKVPFFGGKVLTVLNYQNKDKVNGKNNVGKDGKLFELCARLPDAKEPAKLEVAPCFLPNVFAGDYWIIAAGPSPSNYEWAIISGGQPTEKYNDGCTTKTTGVNGSGFWYFTRKQVASEETIAQMDAAAKKQGFTLSQLHDVAQDGCTYDQDPLQRDETTEVFTWPKHEFVN
eukprot:g1755.t1